ncbi:hypothetical protein [Brachybacterium sacelli]|uniref:DUF4190 domain-containing protein n=1 Tax=Brachybacterium sacelli TaxID=173364 RepID=A0ABS4X3W2_9MICO|nr:hypothetical protein [Brachybacterium sacelli]MBP2383158.1 hypothetical protein [Brachybacterium sacelli]
MSTEHRDDQDQRPSDEAAARPRRLLGALVVTMFASWLLLMAPLPFSLAAGVTALIALVLLILVSVQSFREGRWGMAVLGVVVGVPATLMIVVGSLLSVLFYGPMSQVEECRSTAITEQAKAQCESEAQDSMAGWLSGLLGG